jgi:1,2-diacylglycerol 3-beta-galactosyltransferase
VNLQDLLDPIDFIQKFTGTRLEDHYNTILRRGWTLGSKHLLKVLQAVVRAYHSEESRILEEHWRKTRPDLVVSVIPHFNRAIKESLGKRFPEVPFVTILTDLADYPPHFWIESQDQYFVCGSDHAVEQARLSGAPPEKIFQTSGMIVHPRFYEPLSIDREVERQRLGFKPGLPVGLVMFGGQGSRSMREITRQVDESKLEVQLLLICGRNEELAAELRRTRSLYPRYVEGFTTEVPYYMALSDFFVGKPGPGSISEALLMNLPVIVEENARTLPQERFNAHWIRDEQVGIVVRGFRETAAAIRKMLEPETYSRYRTNTAALRNRAVFEIPDILSRILDTAGSGCEIVSGTSNVSASGTISMAQGS